MCVSVPGGFALVADGQLDAETPLVTIDLEDESVARGIDLVAAAARLNIVVDPAIDARITSHLPDVPWRRGLDVLLRAAEAELHEAGPELRVGPR